MGEATDEDFDIDTTTAEAIINGMDMTNPDTILNYKRTAPEGSEDAQPSTSSEGPPMNRPSPKRKDSDTAEDSETEVDRTK